MEEDTLASAQETDAGDSVRRLLSGRNACSLDALWRGEGSQPGDFPGGLVARTPRLHCRGAALIPGWGTRIASA